MKYIPTLFIIMILLLPACKTKNGPVTEYEGNVRIEGFYKDGLKDSCWRYYENGTKIREENYIMDTLNGKALTWYSSEQLHSEAMYRHGKMVGIFKIWYPNGQLNSLSNHDSIGIEDGEYKIFYETGNVKQTGNVKKGAFHDTWIEYYENGQKENIKIYDNDIKTGKWIYFNEEGDTIRIEEYEKDSLIRIENF